MSYDLYPLIAEDFQVNYKLKLIASAWTAPPWMTNIFPDYYRGGYLSDDNRWVDGVGGDLINPRL
jgi:hypothetical protein